MHDSFTLWLLDVPKSSLHILVSMKSAIARGYACRDSTAAALAAPPTMQRLEKENMTEFIAKKREIFLVQMSLDTKRAEITKLEERALQVTCYMLHQTCDIS